ncbi:dermokine [Acomys russatus]|uniref:dermokine n=1 Tax=Acomys russatus TaxID=60746 RepID=UPI0021E34994|nr:dermokine [Acomys russatus]
MKLQGCLACLLLALCLGSGAASPLQSGIEGPGASAAQGLGDSISHGVGETVGQGLAKEAAGSGTQDALGRGHEEEGGLALREARGDAFDHRLEEAAQSLENAGGKKVGRRAERVIRRETDAVRNAGSWGTSGGHGMFASQGGIGGHGNPGVQGTPWASEDSYGTGSLGGSADQGGDGKLFTYETDTQGAVAQPGYGSVRGNNQNSGCTNPPPSGSSNSEVRGGGSSRGRGGNNDYGTGTTSGGNSGGGSSQGTTSGGDYDYGSTSGGNYGYSSDRTQGNRGGSSSGSRCDNPGNGGNAVRMAGGSGSQESRESNRLLGGDHDYQDHGPSGDNIQNEAVSGLKAVNPAPSSLPFSFDNFWEDLKSKLGFINWDAINKGRLPSPSTRALLYFRRLWENFKRRTPYFNWKQIEGSDLPSLQKRARGADQSSYGSPQGNPNYNWQYYAKTTPKGGVTPSSSSASRAQPGLLKWLKFW